MKVIDVINFYYASHEVIEIKVRANEGIDGRYHKFTKQEACDFLDGFYDEEVAEIIFQTHSIYCGKISYEFEVPLLYILYK
jgi:hypothetical protein